MQEKELIERHNVWLNDELEAKVDSLIKLRRTHADVEAEMSFKLSDVSMFYNIKKDTQRLHIWYKHVYVNNLSKSIYFFLGIFYPIDFVRLNGNSMTVLAP